MTAPLRVSSRSDPHSVAQAVASATDDGRPVTIHVIGAGAVNQAVKAIAIARQTPAGADLVIAPSFVELEVDGVPRTALAFSVEHKGKRRARGKVLSGG